LNPSVELSVYNLLINASLFSKFILLVLLILSVLTWTIMIHKYFFISGYRRQITRFFKSLTGQASISKLEESCSRYGTGSAKTMPILLLRLLQAREKGTLSTPPSAILSNALLHESTKLMSGMNMLATTANASPLIGLLGTVWGVMYAFLNIGLMGSASIAVVAPGIAEALMTTIAGLLVAIPAMAGHNFMTGWINHCLDTLEGINEYTLSILKKERMRL